MNNIFFFFFLITYLCFSCEKKYNTCNSESLIFSHQSGLYDDAFYLSITSSNDDCTILYTLDGSEPDIENLNGQPYRVKKHYDSTGWAMAKQYVKSITKDDKTTRTGLKDALKRIFYLDKSIQIFQKKTYVYSQPILISKETQAPDWTGVATDVKYFRKPIEKSDPITTLRVKKHGDTKQFHYSFFIGNLFSKYTKLPIINITLDPEDLFGYQKGILVPGEKFIRDKPNSSGNYYQRGKEAERLAYLEAFNTSKELNAPYYFRIKGAGSRNMPNKSFKLITRKNIVDDSNKIHYKKFQLRTGSQDEAKTLFRDVLMAKLMHSTKVVTNPGEAVHLFLNGNYWGIRFLREDLSKKQLCKKLNSSNIHVYNAFQDFIDHEIHPHKDTLQQLIEKFDISSVCDNYIANNVSSNFDIHWKAYIDSSLDHPKWSMILWDLDWSLGNQFSDEYTVSYNTFTTLFDTVSTHDKSNYRLENMKLLKILLNDDAEQNFYIQRLATIMSSNLSENNIQFVIDSLVSVLDNSIEHHFSRWRANNNPNYTKENWYNEIDVMKEFVNLRNKYVYQHAIEFFDLKGLTKIQINNPEHLNLNIMEHSYSTLILTQRKKTTSEWEGIFFKEIPLVLEFKDTLHHFLGWEVNGELLSTERCLKYLPISDEALIQPIVKKISYE